MHFQQLDNNSKSEITSLFTAVFTSAEGEKEGKRVGELASALSGDIDNAEIICFGAVEHQSLIACIFFTRLHFGNEMLVYMLAPVAVSSKHQGKGAGQALIHHGLHALKQRAVAFATTYGDPAFYSKVGFQALSEEVIKAPMPLSMPFGWLGQPLTDEPIPAIKARPTCVNAFNHAIYW